jgi:hypothetical protein
LKNSLLVILSIVFIFFVLELGLRFFYHPLNSGWGWNDSPRRNLSSFPEDIPNQFGVRGQKIVYNKDDFIIVLLGDSQVESATSSPKKMPEILLENSLNNLSNNNVKVFSLAASGWGQDQQFLALEKYFNKYRADLVLLWATPKNDFWENAFPDRCVRKTAGHLKPTFRLINNNLSEIYYKKNTYYKNSALIQLITEAWQVLKDETIEQIILRDWLTFLPEPHINFSNKNSALTNNSLEIDMNKFSQNVFDYMGEKNITILTYEDFIDSRSHFAPYFEKKSKRDLYLIDITKKLFQKISSLSKQNNSRFIVFYPIREDFNIIYKNSIKYVKSYKDTTVGFPVNLDYLSLLKSIIPANQLFYFTLLGKNNICVNHKDRHLNEYGNKEVMENVSNFIIKNIL